MALQDKYINPFTDFGFKKLFGTEPNKDLLIDFLNQVLPDRHKVADLSYTPTEQLGNTEPDRKAIFDLYCTSPSGERFIVEMQKANYEKSLKYYRDLKNVVDTSFYEGKEEKTVEFILKSHRAGIDRNTIAQITGKSLQEIDRIIQQGA